MSSDLWIKNLEPNYFRAGEDPKGHFTDEETEVNWLSQGHTAIYHQGLHCTTGLPRWKEPQSSLLGKLCQQVATNLLTGDLSPFVRNRS
jgi:hypothetical protein